MHQVRVARYFLRSATRSRPIAACIVWLCCGPALGLVLVTVTAALGATDSVVALVGLGLAAVGSLITMYLLYFVALAVLSIPVCPCCGHHPLARKDTRYVHSIHWGH